MAILCIRISPNDPPAALRTKPGDVVCIVDDGHVFSRAELDCGQYLFINIPGVQQAEFVSLVAHMEDASGNMIKRRAKTLNIAALNSAPWKTRTSATKAQLLTIIVEEAV